MLDTKEVSYCLNLIVLSSVTLVVGVGVGLSPVDGGCV
jgi:hypothetical protein